MRLALIAGLAIAAPLAAMEPVLEQPIDCVLGGTCYIQYFVDTDPSDGVQDFACGTMTYDTHKGIDFALPSLAAMEKGVDVLAAADGRVVATRDGMEDRIYSANMADRIAGRECGNGLVIDHGFGWQTQYCHLANGSVTVAKGDMVTAGMPLGEVGLSGKTQFPHVHIVVRHRGKVIDPFAPDGAATCTPNGPTQTMWDSDIAYTAGGPISAGFATGIPEYDEIKAGTAHAATLPADAPALVLWGFFHNGRTGDEVALVIDGPDGVMSQTRVTLDKNQPLLFRAGGKRLTKDAWPKGDYSGIVQLIRNGVVIGTDGASTVIE